MFCAYKAAGNATLPAAPSVRAWIPNVPPVALNPVFVPAVLLPAFETISIPRTRFASPELSTVLITSPTIVFEFVVGLFVKTKRFPTWTCPAVPPFVNVYSPWIPAIAVVEPVLAILETMFSFARVPEVKVVPPTRT